MLIRAAKDMQDAMNWATAYEDVRMEQVSEVVS